MPLVFLSFRSSVDVLQQRNILSCILFWSAFYKDEEAFEGPRVVLFFSSPSKKTSPEPLVEEAPCWRATASVMFLWRIFVGHHEERGGGRGHGRGRPWKERRLGEVRERDRGEGARRGR